MLLIFGGGLCTALVVVREFASGVLSNTGLAICLIALSCAVTVAVAITVTRGAKNHAETRHLKSGLCDQDSIDVQRRARRLKTWIIVVNLALIYGLWVNGARVSLPTVVGVLISLSITASLVSILVRLRQINK